MFLVELFDCCCDYPKTRLGLVLIAASALGQGTATWRPPSLALPYHIARSRKPPLVSWGVTEQRHAS